MSRVGVDLWWCAWSVWNWLMCRKYWVSGGDVHGKRGYRQVHLWRNDPCVWVVGIVKCTCCVAWWLCSNKSKCGDISGCLWLVASIQVQGPWCAWLSGMCVHRWEFWYWGYQYYWCYWYQWWRWQLVVIGYDILFKFWAWVVDLLGACYWYWCWYQIDGNKKKHQSMFDMQWFNVSLIGASHVMCTIEQMSVKEVDLGGVQELQWQGSRADVGRPWCQRWVLASGFHAYSQCESKNGRQVCSLCILVCSV